MAALKKNNLKNNAQKIENALEVNNSKLSINETEQDTAEKKSPKSWLSKLTDSQSTLVVALITTFLSLCVSIFLAYNANRTSLELEKFKVQSSKESEEMKVQYSKEIEKYKLDLNINIKNNDAMENSRGEAVKAIWGMKRTLDRVINNPKISIAEAKKIMTNGAETLDLSYLNNSIHLTPDDPFRLAFHEAKNIGNFATSTLNGKVQADNSTLSDDTIDQLKGWRNKLDEKESIIRDLK